jgi:hypothetical protein
MNLSVKKRLPSITCYLISRHADEWAATSRGMISYQLRQGLGYFILLRTPQLCTLRLVSALVATKPYPATSDWQRMRAKFEETGPTSLAEAKHQYFFVSSTSYDSAVAVMKGTIVKVIDWSIVTYTTPAPTILS